MIKTKEYEELTQYYRLPERFRAGDYHLDEEEQKILLEFVDHFYASIESSGCVTLEDFTDFMEFMDLLWCSDSDEVMNVVGTVFVKSAKLQSRLLKRGDDDSACEAESFL